MKVYINSILYLLCGFFSLTGCEKELMEFEGKDSLYFDVRRGPEWISPNLWTHYPYSTVEYGNIIEDEVELSLRIRASGSLRDYDRLFTISVNPDSTTALSGSDYLQIEESYMIKAGEISTQVALIVKRTERMSGDTLKIQLQIDENEHFELTYISYGDFPGAYKEINPHPIFGLIKNAGLHNIFIYDVLSRPAVWSGSDVTGGGLFGKFSAKKFKLMMELSNTTIEDYQNKSTMPSARQTAIGELMATYLLKKAADNDPVLDEDGTMMYFMAIESLGGSSAWKPFTRPEDYYK